jgi:hypothetical protein
MKKVKHIFSILLVILIAACTSDDFSDDFLENAEAPSEISALFTITQDNTGLVTIRPNGLGVTSYKIYFGDATTEPSEVGVGQEITHTYSEGNYNVKVVGVGINGEETEITQPLTVTFVAPQNLSVNIAPQVGNPYQFNISATADFETFFTVTYGEDPAQIPVSFNEGQTVSHTYTAIGTYQVKVIAYSGGAATTEFTQNVTVFDPLLLPINFESPTLNYSFGDFGGANATVLNNPDISAGNTSAKVGRLTKTAGAEIWAGTTLLLDSPIDFTAQQQISVKTWSPVAGAVVKLKLENAGNANINVELDQVTTIANGWETLTYNFTGINNANNYQRIAIFFDFGNNGNGASYYFDDIQLTDGVPQITLPLTFENSALTYSFTNFGGANSEMITNPDQSGINTSANVGRLIKGNGSEVWAGSFINLDQPIDFSTLNKIKIKTWSPTSGITVKLKLENLNNSNINTEVDVTNTVANGWEELTFNFPGIVNANQYQRVVIFFDFGTSGTGASYYFDDIQLTN